MLLSTLTATISTESIILCPHHEFNQTENDNYTVECKTDFPFDYLDCHHGDTNNLSQIVFDRDYGAMAQSFLAWGVITVIYCVVAVFAYVMLNESQEWKHYEQTTNIFYFAVSDHGSFP